MALTKVSSGRGNKATVTEDRASREVANRGRNWDREIDVKMMAEKVRVNNSFFLHDAAIHVVTRVDKDTEVISISVVSTLTTILPLAVDIGTVSSGRVSRATELAPVVAGDSRISSTAVERVGVDTGKNITVDAVVVASSSGVDGGLTSVVEVAVAVSIAAITNEHAVTTSVNVGRVTVAVRINGSQVNVVVRDGG